MVFIKVFYLFLVSIGCILSVTIGVADTQEHPGSYIIIGFHGLSSEDSQVKEVRYLIENDYIAGVILFRRNIESPEQLKSLVEYVKLGKEILVLIDQEGGKVQRLDEQNGFISVLKSPSSYQNKNEVEKAFSEMSSILSEMGINVNLAPVVDLNIESAKGGISERGRSFSSIPDIIVEFATTAILEMKKHNIISCIKHFPGHGNARQDSHDMLPDITDYWSGEDLIPFEKLSDIAPCIMVGHLLNANIDPILPSSISPRTYRLLSNFSGIWITDDYFMQAIMNQYSPEEFFKHARLAGARYVLFAHPTPFAESSLKDFVKRLHNVIM